MIDFVNNNNNSIAEFFDVANRFVNYGAPWLSRIQGVAKLYTSHNIGFILRMNKDGKSNRK